MLSAVSVDYLNDLCVRKKIKGLRGRPNKLFLRGILYWRYPQSNGSLKIVVSIGEHTLDVIINTMFEERLKFISKIPFGTSVYIEAIPTIEGIELTKIKTLNKKIEFDKQTKIKDY